MKFKVEAAKKLIQIGKDIGDLKLVSQFTAKFLILATPTKKYLSSRALQASHTLFFQLTPSKCKLIGIHRD